MSLDIDSLFDVRGKTALVTGGSRGVGEMIARALLANGARVYLCARKTADCEALANELGTEGFCRALPANLAEMSEIERLAHELMRREGRLDLLINNAGTTWGASVESFPEVGWDRVMNLNVKSVFFLTQKLLPLLTAAATQESWARVINIGSIAGFRVSEFDAASYDASKAAVHHLTRVLAKKLAGHRIAVNAIAPGWFPSRMTLSVEEEFGERTRLATPMLRSGTAQDVGGLVLFLASRAGSFMTGQIAVLDGGLSL